MAGASLSSLHLKFRIVSVVSAATETQTSNWVQLPQKTRNSRVLVLGGTGRGGGSTAIALFNLCSDLQIIVAGRNREKGAAILTTLGGNSEYCEVDINNDKSLADVDLVVHATGPFQQAEKCTVLEAALKTKTAYLDVCDDTAYAFRVKSYHDRAVQLMFQL